MSLQQQPSQQKPVDSEELTPEHMKRMVLGTVEVVLFRSLPDIKKFLIDEKCIIEEEFKKLFSTLYATVGQYAMTHMFGMFKMSPDQERLSYIEPCVEKLFPTLSQKEKELLSAASDRLISFCSSYQVDEKLLTELHEFYDYLSQEKKVIYDAKTRLFTYLSGVEHEIEDEIDQFGKKIRSEIA